MPDAAPDPAGGPAPDQVWEQAVEVRRRRTQDAKRRGDDGTAG